VAELGVGGDERPNRNERNGPPLSVTIVTNGSTLPFAPVGSTANAAFRRAASWRRSRW
jgi:hypothetical protein